MPISPFRLKGTIGRNYKIDFDDTLRLKEALEKLGYYSPPESYGRTGYPDEAMFEGVERFQSDNRLQRDGVMKPGGETASAMGVQLASLQDNLADKDSAPAPSMAPDDTHVAASGTRPVPFGPPLPFGPARELGKQLQRWWDGDRWPDPSPANENERTSITNPIPPVSQPNAPLPKLDNKTEFPASGPEVPQALITPIPSPRDPNILIYPVPDKGLATAGTILDIRRETAETKAQIDRIADWFWETHDQNEWRQYGGRDKNGNEIPEYYIPGPAGDFTREDGRTPADGRKGSRRPDLTFINLKTGQKIHIQTVDVDKNNQVTPRERAAEADIWRLEFLRSRNPDKPGNVQLHIIPKNAQIKDYRRIP